MGIRIAAQITAEGLTYGSRVGGVTTSIAIPDGVYHMPDLITAANLAEAGTDVTWSINSGLIKCTLSGGYTVDWTGHEDLRDLFGFTGTSILVTGFASRRSAYLLDLTELAMADLEEPERLVAQSVSDTSVYTSYYGSRDWRKVEFHFRGQPRSTVATEEYECLRRMWHAVFSRGVPFRYYPDVDTETAELPENRWTAPWGYQDYVHYSPGNFAPRSLARDWYEHWAWAATWHPAVSPAYDLAGSAFYSYGTTPVVVPTIAAVNESVDGLVGTITCGSFSLASGATLKLVGNVSEAGLTLSVRLHNLTASAWAGDAVEITDTDPEEVTGVITIASACVARLHMTLTGGDGAADEVGFLGSATIED